MPIQMKRDVNEGAHMANSFGSYNVTIPTDDVAILDLPCDYGHLMVSSVSSGHHGMFWFRGSAVTKYFGGNRTDAGTGELTGTTGTATNMTVSASGNKLYIENRQTAELKVAVTLLGVDKTFDVRFKTWSRHVDKTTG